MKPVAARRMDKKILVINGHPDPRPERFCAALSQAYLQGAVSSGLDVKDLTLGTMTETLTSPSEDQPAEGWSGDVGSALDLLRWANQLVLIFPLWLDAPPIPLQSLFKQAGLVPRFSSKQRSDGGANSSRVFVTMEMPAFAHRAMFCSRVNANRRTFALPGMENSEPVFIGSVGAISAESRARWLSDVRQSGAGGH